MTDDLMSAAVDVLVIAFSFAMITLFDMLLAGISLGLIAIYAAVRLIFLGRLRNEAEDVIVAEAKESTHFIETVEAIEAIKIFGREEVRRSMWQNDNARLMNAAFRHDGMKVGFRLVSRAVNSVGTVIVVYIAASKVTTGGMSVGMLISFLFYYQYFRDRSLDIVDKLSELHIINLHVQRIADIATAQTEPLGGASASGGKIELVAFEDVGFSYALHERRVLSHFDARIERGQFIAIVGPSGCGKTTFAKLLLGLYRPSEGRILVNGTPLEAFGLADYRRRVGAVTQDDRLLGGSLIDNISFFDPEPDRDRIERCARLAEVHDEIAAMPMGYETLLGDVGSVLSGGQKQRILLARALYRDPDILILDEGTANLDAANERAIADLLERLPITRVVIAHRPELVQRADKVYRVVEGRLLLVREGEEWNHDLVMGLVAS